MDRMVVDATGDHRSCIECGFSDERPRDPVREPATRVTRPAARRVETRAEPITLLEPDKQKME
jgi:hypothetical protein